MKKFLVLLMVAVALVMSGCSDEMRLYKNDEIAAVEICEKNEGYKFYELRQAFLSGMPHKMEVFCKDGAVFVLGAEKIFEEYERTDGGKYTTWAGGDNYKWVVQK